MLQQTRASVVVPYFLRWMEKFPDVKALYNASVDEVIKAWEGLGYYSRARNIHAAARQIVEEFGGEIPDTREELSRIKGFGPYTVGAVLSFAFHRKAPAIDGNVVRVISRLFGIEDDVTLGATRKVIEQKVESLLDLETPWVTGEALIELGALVCTPVPRCAVCPLQGQCEGFIQGKADALPTKKKRAKTIHLFRTVFVVEWMGKVLVRKGASGKVMADLYEFPYIEGSEEFLKGTLVRKLTPLTHTFTRYKSHLSPVWIRIDREETFPEYEWVEIFDLRRFPFSSGHRQIAIEVEKIHVQG